MLKLIYNKEGKALRDSEIESLAKELVNKVKQGEEFTYEFSNHLFLVAMNYEAEVEKIPKEDIILEVFGYSNPLLEGMNKEMLNTVDVGEIEKFDLSKWYHLKFYSLMQKQQGGDKEVILG